MDHFTDRRLTKLVMWIWEIFPLILSIICYNDHDYIFVFNHNNTFGFNHAYIFVFNHDYIFGFNHNYIFVFNVYECLCTSLIGLVNKQNEEFLSFSIADVLQYS